MMIRDRHLMTLIIWMNMIQVTREKSGSKAHINIKKEESSKKSRTMPQIVQGKRYFLNLNLIAKWSK
jgi:hypothetical protein